MRTRTLILTLCLAAILLPCRMAAKHNISVLYVGGSPNRGVVMGLSGDSAKLAASAKERAADFTRFLRSRFKKVKSIDASDYQAAMSDNYDVTVFDGRPKPHSVTADSKGRPVVRMLPEGFDRPTVSIADASAAIRAGSGSKNDWYCLCLQNKAMRWKKDHPIFKGPYKVNIIEEINPVPAGAIEFAELYGEQVPDSVEMWTVQKLNYTDDPEIRIGLVCRPWGYEDSPEAEIISGGVSSKSIDAVAIGRHANFFHWGFGASPSGLTDAGRAALANAIIYMAELGPCHIIARKDNDEIATRSSITHAKGEIARTAWDTENKARMNFYLKVDSGQKVVKAKLAAGQPLTLADSAYMSIPPQRKPQPTPYADFIRQREPDLFHIFGEEIEEYNRYYDRNAPWFRPAPGAAYRLDIDEDVRSLGIANNDIRLLETCIDMLERGGNDAAKASAILERYTLCRFATPAEWRQWFTANRDRLFFTESGGWLWLVNTQDTNIPGNDYSVLTKGSASAVGPDEKTSVRPDAAPTDTPQAATDRQNPVAAKAELVRNPDGTRDIVITLNIHPGFHLYANVDESDPFIPTEIKLTLPDGVKADGPMSYPAVDPSKNATTYYKGLCRFIQRISGDSDSNAVCELTYQCCDNSVCMRPVNTTLNINLK